MLLRAGDCQQAIRIRRELAQQASGNLAYKGNLATALVACGFSRDEARAIADALAKVDRPFLRGEHLYERARILAALGDDQDAIRALQAAHAQGTRWPAVELHLDQCWDPIRRSPAFVEMLKPKG
jgi:hypothetical protein